MEVKHFKSSNFFFSSYDLHERYFSFHFLFFSLKWIIK